MKINVPIEIDSEKLEKIAEKKVKEEMDRFFRKYITSLNQEYLNITTDYVRNRLEEKIEHQIAENEYFNKQVDLAIKDAFAKLQHTKIDNSIRWFIKDCLHYGVFDMTKIHEIQDKYALKELREVIEDEENRDILSV